MCLSRWVEKAIDILRPLSYKPLQANPSAHSDAASENGSVFFVGKEPTVVERKGEEMMKKAAKKAAKRGGRKKGGKKGSKKK